MQNRRTFLKKTIIAGSLMVSGGFPFRSLAGTGTHHLTLLHTNDTHSRLDPFPMDGGSLQGLGGVAVRKTLIEKIRQEQEHVLLLDAGDIFQGTPYFNLYKGEPEIKAMSNMGYDAATMGNHDFDAGIDGFAAQLKHARFPFLVANYDFKDTALEGKIFPYKIFRKGELKIGILGLGIELSGIVPASVSGKIKYLDPVGTANHFAAALKQHKGCHLVVCLSHLGYQYEHNKISDCVLAQQTENIDIIIGGHTHTFLEEPAVLKNKAGQAVIVNQVGWGGVRLGKLDLVFDYKKSTKLINAQTVFLRKETIG